MKKNILIGTHHKTGTIWMNNVFRKFAKLTDTEFYNISQNNIDEEKKRNILKEAAFSEKRSIYFDYHSNFPEIETGQENQFKGIHLIRNPLDVLISSTLYHSWSGERWLHVNKDKYDKMTYQDKINSLGSIKEKLEFEMSNSALNTIKKMANFNIKNIFLQIKFEELIIDRNFYEVIKIARHFELEGEEIILLLRAFFNESTFGKQSDIQKKHIQSKSKKSEYREILELEMSDKFNLLFKQEMKKLGYQ